MSDELTQAPRIDGEFWVFADGRRLPRLRGAEEVVDAAEDTPADDAAPDGTPAEDSEYTPERARGLHAELTKAQQQLAEVNHQKALWTRAQQGDLDAMRELQLPIQFEDDADTEDDAEDSAFRDPRLDQLLQEREQERMQKQQEEGWNRFNSDLDQVAKGKQLSDDDRLTIYTKTMQAGGSPDALSQAFSDFAKAREAYDKSVIEAYIKSKRAPYVSPGGTGATEEVLPLDASHKDRVRYMTEKFQLGQQS